MALQDKITTLSSVLQKHLPWHKARLKFLAGFVLGLARTRTVCFGQLSTCLNHRSCSTNLRRIQRFFAEFTFDLDILAKLLMAQVPRQRSYVLSLDRTNWQFAGVNYNALCLAVVIENLSIPLLWTMLPKRGNSNQEERIALVERYIRLFGLDSIQAIVADREFIGRRWVNFLSTHHIQFGCRIKANTLVHLQGRQVKAFWLFQDLALNQVRQLEKPVQIQDEWLYLSGSKIRGDKSNLEYLLVITYRYEQDVMEMYKQRWAIECFFKAIKSAGFHIEDTHLTDLKRFEKLFAVVCLAYVWVYLTGAYQHQKVPIPVLSHGRKAFSIFRYGLDAISQALLLDNQQIITYIKLLSCT